MCVFGLEKIPFSLYSFPVRLWAVISGTIEHVVYLLDFDGDLHMCIKYFYNFELILKLQPGTVRFLNTPSASKLFVSLGNS